MTVVDEGPAALGLGLGGTRRATCVPLTITFHLHRLNRSPERRRAREAAVVLNAKRQRKEEANGIEDKYADDDLCLEK